MKIKSIELAWFRGAANPVSLEPNCKSMIIYGENGSGKWSFVDAVEYALNKGRVEHLRTEYSGFNQVNAIPNTQKPEGEQPALKFQFEDDTELKIHFRSDGSSESSGVPHTLVDEWEYRQTVLRQNEVSDFIHDTKGQKYSALLPLFGLRNVEVAAENLRKLAKAVETEAKVPEKKVTLKQVEDQRKATFGTQRYDRIIEIIDNLYSEYFKIAPATIDALSRCIELKSAVDNRIKQYTAEDRMYVSLREVVELNLKGCIEAVRASSVELAGSIDPDIADRLTILQSATGFGDRLEEAGEVDCPACGRKISVDVFREHVKAETERLQEFSETFDTYKAVIRKFANSVESLKSLLAKLDLKTWVGSLDDVDTLDALQYLAQLKPLDLRESCSSEVLNEVERKLLPIISAAARDSKNAPPDVQALTRQGELLTIAKSVITSRDLAREVGSGEALVALINSLEQGVRAQIRRQSQKLIDSISGDIERMWATLHPGAKIDSVRLSLPPNTDKAIDVVLKFHGLNQESPRLTLSEGYRNSLGLCIFLAMAKQVADTEQPMFLDDVVVSLDRNHRGMIQELLEMEFNDRQVIIFTHDRDWYTELRYQLGGNNRWLFKMLRPYEEPAIGIRWSDKTTTFDEARALVEERPDAAANDARKIMDIELSIIAEQLRIRLPYQRADKNDLRMAHEFLTRLISDGRKCFEKRSGDKYVENKDAIDACAEANRLLVSWANRGSHTFDITKAEAKKLIKYCEIAIASFRCDTCDPPRYVWKLEDSQSKLLRCDCGDIRWRYGKV